MVAKPNGKRPANYHLGSAKKRKISVPLRKHKVVPRQKTKGKEKAAEREIIPIPAFDDEDDMNLSEHDLEVLEEYGPTASFLSSLDHKAISRSKNETMRLHRLHKPPRQARQQDDLPSIDSHDEDENPWDSDIEENFESEGSDARSDFPAARSASISIDSDASDIEKAYEVKRQSLHMPQKGRELLGLPIKLPDGRIHSTGKIVVIKATKPDEQDEESSDDASEVEPPHRNLDDFSTGARFGRPSVIDVVVTESRATRIAHAKEQIAGICQEILADPENSLGHLRRLHTFSMPEIRSSSHPEPVPNDLTIRKLAILSQLAIFKDIIPGYRIRPLTEKEKGEKVSQMVARTREWEQGLLVIYQTYLRSLEVELKARSDMAEVALKCICTLLDEVPHFNFRINLMVCVVNRLSKKSWDQSSILCLDTLIRVFREDLTGAASLEIVRLLNRMVREKRFNVHPEVLSCLLHLRLKTELGVRASDSAVDKSLDAQSSGKTGTRRAKKKDNAQPYLSKKAKKALREKKEIDKEFREAEAEVDKEERAATQTETLKLLFVLYFRILKNPHRTPLLPPALHGISKFAHLINIDFFRDLMTVLKNLILGEHDSQDINVGNLTTPMEDIQYRLLCIITAFELLSGQGDSLNIDLSDFVTCLYALIPPLSLLADIDGVPQSSSSRFSGAPAGKMQSTSDLLFHALAMVFSPRSVGVKAPSGRSAAFAKRLLSASIHWPAATTLRTLDFVHNLIVKDSKLESLLSTEDRNLDGVYRPDIDDPELCHPFGTSLWELQVLHRSHLDPKVRDAAGKILNIART